MKDFKQLLKELPSSTIVCAMGEFDPPTVGHEILVKTVKRLAEEKSSDHVIFTHPAKNSILQEDKKSQYLSLMFPKTKFKSLDESFASAISNLKQKYKNVVVVAGSDQISSVKRGLKESVEFIAITEKNPDANETKMKSFATKALYEQFKKKLPTTIRELDGKRLMNDVRQGMGLEPVKEQLKLVKDELREQYFRGDIFNIGDIVESGNNQYQIVKRGSNHLLLKNYIGELTSKWIHDVKLVQENAHHNHQHTKITHHSDHKEITHGDAFSLKIGKEHHQNINDLEHGGHHVFKCMDGKEWHAVRHGDNVHFVFHPDDMRIHTNYHPNLPHSHFTGETEHEEITKPSFQTMFANGDTMVKEGVIQPNGTDQVKTVEPDKVDSKDQNGNPTPRAAGVKKGFLTFYGYTKDQNDFKVAKMESVKQPYTQSDSDKDNESDIDAAAQDPLMYDPSVVGHSLVSGKPPKGSHHLRRMKVNYGFREAKEKDSKKVLPHDKEVAHIKNDSAGCGCNACAGGSGQNTVSLRQEDIDIPKDAPSVETIAKKHGVSVDHINKQLEAGMKVEAEHGKNPGSEREIALDHLNEKPDYYVKLKKFVEHQINEYSGHLDSYRRYVQAAQNARSRGEHHIARDAEAKAKFHADAYRKMTGKHPTHLSLEELEETKRMSAQVKLQRAFNREKEKRERSERLGQELLNKQIPQPTGSPQSQRPFDPFFKEEELTDAEIDLLIDSITFEDDILELYEEDELVVVYEDTGEELPVAEEEAEIELMEMLSRQERMKSKIRFRRSKAKRDRSTKIALKRFSPVKVINARARRLAIKLMKQRLLRGRKYSEVSIGDKERIDKTIANRKASINRIAAKLISRIRGTEKSRMSHGRVTKGDQPNVF